MSYQWKVYQNIKEKFSYIAMDFNKELSNLRSSKPSGAQYSLPDGKVINSSWICINMNPRFLISRLYVHRGNAYTTHTRVKSVAQSVYSFTPVTVGIRGKT